MLEELRRPVTRKSGTEHASMYTDYFRLKEAPFSLTPDPRYLYMSERHREGLAHLFYGVQQPGGFVQLTGEVGCGKTTLCRCLVRQLPPETDVALILNPRLTAIELLATVCDELRIPYPADNESIKTLIDALNQHLLEAHELGRRTVLIIDEAQNLDSDVLEQVRLLTNLETSQEKLLQIILIGQPELLDVLKRKKLRQIAQRITARYHLDALSKAETHAYIQHRILCAGRRDSLFTKPATTCVYHLSGGVPRLINIICDRALLGTYALNKRRVTAAIVRRASRETQGMVPFLRELRRPWVYALATILVIALGTVLFLKGYRPVSGDDRTSLPQPDGSKSQITAVARSGAATPAGQLNEMLERSTAQEPPSSGVSHLLIRWGVKSQLDATRIGCGSLGVPGFECLSGSGSWPKLRRYDTPAILEMVIPKEPYRKPVTLVGLNEQTATFIAGGKEYSFPMSEIDRVWDGSFTIIWKPPFAQRQVAPGSRGQEVLWVRNTLDQIEGKTPGNTGNDVFDENLRKRVMIFQRENSLIPDGYVGTETLVRLTLALAGPEAPSLSNRVRQVERKR